MTDAVGGRGAWGRALPLGTLLSAAAIWPVAVIRIGKGQLLGQPALLLLLLGWAVFQARRAGWGTAGARAACFFAVFSVAAWLPWLRTIPSTPEFQFPDAYRHYLALYEAALAGLLGFLARPSGAWGRPLVMAPVALLIRAVWFGHWMASLAGVLLGVAAAWLRPWRGLPPRVRERMWRAAPWGLFAGAVLLVFAAGMRLYRALGLELFLLNSDDGNTYYAAALRVAQDPMWFLTSPEADLNFFSIYPPLMGAWFRLVGPHLPSWLVWQGVAAGLLALAVYWLGRLLGSRTAGLVAAGLVILDHVMVHLMATLNTETLMFPALYAALCLWVVAGERCSSARTRSAFAAGVMFGVATLFRPTVALMPGALACLLFWERPALPWRKIRSQGGALLAGFAVPMLLVLMRHRIAWGHWSLGESRGSVGSWKANYAWNIDGQHPAVIGLGPWARVVAADPSAIWREMIPDWWAQLLELWTHQGFGQMDLVQGLNHGGPYRAALAGVMALGVLAGIAAAVRRRTRGDLVLCALPAYFTSLALVYYVINTRYRSPFIPALYLLACLGWAALIAAIRQRRPTASEAAAVPGVPELAEAA